MAGRLLDSRLAFLAAAPIAIPLGYVAAMWPLYALAGVGVFILLLLAVTRVETLLLALAAVLPWEGALAYPTESVSVVKILGVAAVRGLAAAGARALRAAAGEPRARLGRLLRARRRALAAVRARPADSVARRAALRAVHRVLLPRPAAHAHDRGRAQARPRRRPLVHAGRRVGRLRLRRARPRARRRADRGPERLRLPDGVRAPARLLPARRGEAPPSAVGLLLRGAARRDAGHAVARRAGRARRPRPLGHHHAPRAGDRRAARRRRPAQRRGARRSRCGHRCCNDRLERQGQHRRARTWARARRCGRARCGCPWTARSPGSGPGRFGVEAPAYVRNNPIDLRRACRPQLLSPRRWPRSACSA